MIVTPDPAIDHHPVGTRRSSVVDFTPARRFFSGQEQAKIWNSCHQFRRRGAFEGPIAVRDRCTRADRKA
jgi:hypothetical protein